MVLFFMVGYKVLTSVNLYTTMRADVIGKYLIEVGHWKTLVLRDFRGVGLDILSALGIAGFFWSLVFVTRGRGMGAGDISLGGLVGLVNGFPNNILAVFLGFVFGSIFSIPLVILGKKKMKDAIAFGPFLLAGSIFCLLYGNQVINWYSSLLSS